MRRFTTGIGSLLLLVVLLVGIPAALVFVSGNPFPSFDELTRAMTMPDYGGAFLVGTLLPLVAWIAWATFAVGFLVELPAQIRGIEAPTLPGLSFQQKGAAVLIAAILMMFVGAGTFGPASSASAAEPTSNASSASQTFDVQVATAPIAEEASAEVAPVEDAAPAPTYTVRDGDSLWRIAETHLGSGDRYQEIAQLNYGAVQSDGHSLTAEHWLNAGWVLTLPADAVTEATAVPAGDPAADQAVTVEAGDTLWGIAEDELGDGARYTELFDASADNVQPDGQTLTDPNLIQPGWNIDVPGASTAASIAPSPAPASAPAEVAPAPAVDDLINTGSAHSDAAAEAAAPIEETASTTPENDLSGLGIQTTAPTQAPAEQTAPAAAAVNDDETWIDDAFSIPLATAGGIAGILAAGLLSVLGIRRLKQRRRRLPGQRISMPAEDISAMELELRAVENPMGMDDVDHVLRHLAVWSQDTGIALPPVYAIRLAPTEISIYLDASTDLPEPFVAVTEDKQAWIIDPTDLPELDRIPSAPYPALVTLGHDQTDAHILVDLEHIGALNLVGPPAVTEGALTALAVELATSRWAEDLQITLVGVAEGLPSALDTGRIRHVEDLDTLLRNLRGQASATEEALAALGVDSIEQARSLGEDAEAWIPEIVILGELPDQQTQDELAELVTRLPRVGIASITNGQLVGNWTLELGEDRTAVLQPLGLPLRPQIVNESEYGKILELLNLTETAAVDGPTWSTHIDREEIPLEDIAPATQIPETVPSVDQLVDVVDDAEDDWKDALRRLLPVGADEDEDTAPAAAELEETTVAVQAPADVDEDSFEGNPIVQLRQAPHVRLLGTVGLHGARGEEPRTAQTSTVNRSVVNRATELIAFLALNPGANAVEVHAALWPTNDPTGKQAQQSRNGLVTRARKWLGNSDDGAPFLPPVGTKGYRLAPQVRSDWDVWLELIGDDVTTTPTKKLAAALRLVDGQPFSGVKDKNYIWAERIRQEMIAAIGDAAHELATRSLRAGDIKNARLAAAIGREVDPINELFWRDALRAEHQAGDAKGVDRVVAQLENHLQGFEDGYEAEPETAQLIREIRSHAMAS
jgi:nucleoid-associated protein YgaU/DNA-binding SARP family transcriptional activator